ncbi:MAG: hypothetical protein Q9219_003356 [cf. Caloplaca sp. 3 TL-2023]
MANPEERNARLTRADSHDSQTASEFIDSQLQLEADAREALPYTFDHCTQALGFLRQNLYSCLTCNPPPESPSDPYTPAGVCYSCSIACHGEHELVELFNRRNFTCDCGTTRLPSTSPCTLRINPATGVKGPVHSESAAQGNTYNLNFRNRFCGCGELYNAHTEKGTMFQCLGLAGESEGGCGEDWWHPECLLGLGRDWSRHKKTAVKSEAESSNGVPAEADENHEEEDQHEELPPGFPPEDNFETFICHKCVDTNPWIKRYAGSTGFLSPAFASKEPVPDQSALNLAKQATGDLAASDDGRGMIPSGDLPSNIQPSATDDTATVISQENEKPSPPSLKRKAGDEDTSTASFDLPDSKKVKSETTEHCYRDSLPEPPSQSFSLFVKEDFRDHFCRCIKCYPDLRKHPQLLEEEESYEPPLSEDGEDDRASAGTGSLLDRGEAALNNVDRVRAIEGVMAYNHLKDKVKSFLQPFAESGQAVGAEDIKAYFEKLRGDEQAIRAAAAAGSGGPGDGDNRREQSGY